MHSAVVVCVLCLSSCAPTERASTYIAAFSDTLDTTHYPFEQLRLRVAEPIEWSPVKPDLRSQLHSFSAWSIGSGRVDELRRIGQETEASLFLFLDREPDKRIIGCSVRESVTGALLADAALSARGEALYADLAVTMERALTRWSVPRENQTRVGIVLTSDMLSEAEALHVDMFTDLIERRLSATADVIVLPRQLAKADFGSAPPPDMDVDAFVLLDVQTEANGVRCGGAVRDQDNEVISTFSLQPRPLDDSVAVEVCREVRRALSIRELPNSEWSPAAELKRRRAIAQVAAGSKNHELAIRSLESALLLQADAESELELVDAQLACLRHWAPLRREIPAGGKKRDLSLRWPLQERQQITLRTFQLGRRATERVSGDSLEQLTQMNRIPESGNRIYSQLSILRNSSCDRPLLDRMWEDVRVQMVHHVPAWQRLVLRDDTATGGYCQFMQRRMGLLMWSWIDNGMHPRVDDSSRAAGPVEVGMRWLDYFDTLPDENRPWGVLNSMMRDATMPLGPDGPELFDSLFRRLADHPSPVVQLYGVRGRLMGEFTVRTPEADIKVPRVEEVRKQALVVLDDALETGDLKVKSVVVDFLWRTYEGIAFQAKPQMVQEFVAACDALLDRGINPPTPMIEGLSGADGQFVEEEVRVLERVITMFPTSKFQRRLDAARKRYQEKSSATDPKENGE